MKKLRKKLTVNTSKLNISKPKTVNIIENKREGLLSNQALVYCSCHPESPYQKITF